MVCEKHIAFLRQRQARYLVGTPKADLRRFECELAEKESWAEQYALCCSQARSAKERAMLKRQMAGLSEELAKIDSGLRTRSVSDLEKVGRRIGPLQGRCHEAARLLEVAVIKDEKGTAPRLEMSFPLQKVAQADLLKAASLLRTDCTERDPSQLWRWCIQLTQTEVPFRTAKNDIGLRPGDNQKTDRVEAHRWCAS